MKPDLSSKIALAALTGLCCTHAWCSTTNVYMFDVPDYDWYAGCMGTASGNLMGFWDRHGFPDFYTGTASVGGIVGVPPLTTGNGAITSLWASKAGVDGRPADKPGHMDDYYTAYEDTGADPFVAVGRAEHTPDCLCDFMGVNQAKWTNMNHECNGNIDGFCFNYWDTNGDRRVNFVPDGSAGPPVDVQSGLRAWTRYRGYDCTVFSQLTDFNPNKPTTNGFTFDDLKAEIDSGYPVLLFLQSNQWARTVGTVSNVNPMIHSMLAFGYTLSGTNRYVVYVTSWGQGSAYSLWGPQAWQAGLPVRGVICYHPLPRIRQCSVSGANLSIRWDGPASVVSTSYLTPAIHRVQGYLVEMSPSLDSPSFSPVSSVLLTNVFTLTNCTSPAFVRVRMVKP